MYQAGKTSIPEGLGALALEGEGVRALVIPERGAQLYSLTAFGREWLDASQGILPQDKIRCGAPILFPTPNRMTNATYTFQGRTYHQTVNGVPRILHGLAYDAPFVLDELCADSTGAWCTLHTDFVPGAPGYQAYPFDSRLTVTWKITQQGVTLSYKVENLGTGDMPFGFAWHPYFTKDGAGEVVITAGVDCFYQATACYPTGGLLSVEDYPTMDLRGGRKVSELRLDEDYFGVTPDTVVRADYVDLGIGMQFFCTAEFTHLVVFTPPKKPFFCIENQTCSTDAINLHAYGNPHTGLMILPAGGVHSGSCGITLSRL
nr:aldose 1-epimerase [bacterium]